MQQRALTEELTRRQLQVLKAVAGFQVSRCYSPTIGELAEQLSISRSTAFEHIGELRRKNLLSASPGRARSLKLTARARKLLDRLSDNGSSGHVQSEQGIPLVGKVAAGVPIEAVEDNQVLSIGSQFVGDDVFALQVAGDSMIDDDIRDGDYVICRHAKTSRDGQLIVARIDNENATLKRFYKETNRVRLQPANDDYQPIYSDNCQIDAVVVGLVRKL